MRGSAAFRVAVAPGGALAGPWVQNSLWTRARALPSLDLRFADNKSLTDAVTGAQLVTFTRASSGTYVGSDGLIKTAVTNLLLRSEEFDNADWTKTRSSITSNTIVAPDGTLTGDKLVEDTTASNTHQVSQSASLTAGTHTYSIFAKAGERSVLQTFRSNLNIDLFTHTFNLSTGTASGTGASIVSVGNGWYLCIGTVTVNTTGSTGINFSINNGSTNSYTGDGTSGIYIWGAQLEQSATVGEYVPTTSTINSAPRFDHNPTTGESLGLLVEEAGTNLLLSSEEFDSASWLGAVLTANTQVAPNGTTTADTLTATPGTPSFYQTVTCTASTAYTFSFYVKLGTMPASDFRFAIRDDTAGAFIATNIVPNVTPVTTEWRRVTYTLTTPVGCLLLRVYPYRSTIITGGTAFFWGAQLEAGAFATSYIPTTTATVTRAADVASISGANFSSWYNQTEGTVLMDGTNSALSTTAFAFSDGTINNRLQMDAGTNTRVARVVNGGITQASNSLAYTYNTPQKFSISYATNSINFANAGVLGTEDTSATIPAVDQAKIGANPTNANQLNGHIRRLAYWPTRFGSEVLQRITQP
jgi:hypothetical protein